MPAVDGYRWKDRRAQLDITTETAADELGIHKRTLQNIETTAGYPVKLEVIYRASRLYNVSAAWLRGDDDAPPQPPPEPPKREPSGDPRGPEPRRNGKDDRRGPRRSASLKAAS
jgi:DNA-binding XRE family transcriptional regulator